ncbi:TetR/AcrR family transcriptional regulator [Paenibacillus durus]|uniref:AcrR family transcriptional regulator n=1 Tax=Paenibacillus durus TaxID=44251 RepID=A0A089IXS2_PAEDU|nr:TetR/AcrR family transcriptional regulator [Paenibacillus durus]AIQ13749.1 AcrR family transcriptional regulator [Paenibacillus durus]
MPNEKINPIAEQSKTWLIEALLELMKHKTYSQITISEIAEKAQLARRTFYRNFKSKDEVLNGYVQKLCEEYIERLQAEPTLTVYNMAKVYFTFWEKHMDFLMRLENNDLLHLLLQKYNQYLPVIHRTVVPLTEPGPHTAMAKYIMAFSAGGFWNSLIQWIREERREAPEQMAQFVSMIINETILEKY